MSQAAPPAPTAAPAAPVASQAPKQESQEKARWPQPPKKSKKGRPKYGEAGKDGKEWYPLTFKFNGKVVDHNFVDPETGEKAKCVKLDAWPDDWDEKRHYPVPHWAFKNRSVVYDWQADQLEKQVAKLREQADQARKLGDSDNAARVKKLQKMQEERENLLKQLIAEGIDPKEFGIVG